MCTERLEKLSANVPLVTTSAGLVHDVGFDAPVIPAKLKLQIFTLGRPHGHGKDVRQAAEPLLDPVHGWLRQIAASTGE